MAKAAKKRAAGRRAGAKRITVGSVNVPGYRRAVNADMYEAARNALLKVLPRKAPGLTQSEMFDAATPHLPEALFPGGAKANWWLKSVQLDLEAKKVVVRDERQRPLRWRRVK